MPQKCPPKRPGGAKEAGRSGQAAAAGGQGEEAKQEVRRPGCYVFRRIPITVRLVTDVDEWKTRRVGGEIVCRYLVP